MKRKVALNMSEEKYSDSGTVTFTLKGTATLVTAPMRSTAHLELIYPGPEWHRRDTLQKACSAKVMKKLTQDTDNK